MSEAGRAIDPGRFAPGESASIAVFGQGDEGGNPALIVLNASAMTDEEMRLAAQDFGHECGFVLPAQAAEYDYELRFWVPEHEMSMCGHATVGAAWLLDRLAEGGGAGHRVQTLSGMVEARFADRGAGAGRRTQVSQPAGTLELVPAEYEDALCSVLGIEPSELGSPIRNAATSRVKTLIPLSGSSALDALTPEFDRVKQICDAVGSTGLYPYAVEDAERQMWSARQFPRASGYPEDAATGIAAAALATGLADDGQIDLARPISVFQGRAMGRPSRIDVEFSTEETADGEAITGLWLGGEVRLDQASA